MKLFSITTFFLLCSLLAFSQQGNRNLRFQLYSSITQLKNSKSIEEVKRNMDSLNQVLFKDGKAEFLVDQKSKYKLISCVKMEWEHVIGQEMWLQEFQQAPIGINFNQVTIIPGSEVNSTVDVKNIPGGVTKLPKVDSSARKRTVEESIHQFEPHELNKHYLVPKKKTLFTGMQIRQFLVEESNYPAITNSVNTTRFPVIHERSDPLNRKFIPFSKGDF